MSRSVKNRAFLACHLRALRFLSLLYRKPDLIQRFTEDWSRRRITQVMLSLFGHSLPYILLLAIPGRWFLFEGLGLPISRSRSFDTLFDHVLGVIVGVATSLALGLAVGLVWSRAFGRAGGLAVGVAFCLLGGVAFSSVGGLASGYAVGLAIGFGLGFVVGIVFSLIESLKESGVEGLGFGVASGLTLMLAEGLPGGLGLLIGWQIGFVLAFFRPYYLPLHLSLIWPKPRPELFGRHPVVWDDCCQLEYRGLHLLLVAHAELYGDGEIDRLIDRYQVQRPQALRAKTVIIARQAAQQRDLAAVGDLLNKLPEGDRGYLSQTKEIRDRVLEISRLQSRIKTLDRPFLAEPFAELLVKTIDQFCSQIAGFEEPLASEFRSAGQAWKEVASEQSDRIRNASKTPTRQVFRAGDPVSRDKEAYLYRGGPIGEIERLLMMANGCPGLVIYGRRRMGKSTLIQNLSGVLPSTVSTIYLSMQSSRAFDSLAAFVSSLSARLIGAVGVPEEEPIHLMGLERLLDRINLQLEERGHRLLLALDEYEMLDEKIGQGTFPEDLLASIRESIQSHRQIIWAFVGSHRIDELRHAPWSSYLVSARTIDIEPFSLDETRILLTEPMKHSSLWKDDEPNRPSFHPRFWGEGGIERIHAETGGWPHLVQLVAETTVDQTNDFGQESVDTDLLESSLNKAAKAGDTVFHQLLNGESTLAGEWPYLRGFAFSATQRPPVDRDVQRSLKRRLLVAEENAEWRLRAPIMGRWLKARG